MNLRKKVIDLIRLLGLNITLVESSTRMNQYRESLEDYIRKNEFFMKLQSDPKFEKALDACKFSRSQLGADIFALDFLNFKEDGFFIECGAGDGFNLSNTLLLEKSFGWKGILVEPNEQFHSKLQSSRDAIVEKRLLSSESGHLIEFSELKVGELSGITNSIAVATKDEKRRYLVESISLRDLLIVHQAPSVIDYLSLDVEGHEYEILKGFDFLEFQFRIMSIEHNFSDSRNLIHELLTSHGYRRVHQDLSSFDDFYIGPERCL